MSSPAVYIYSSPKKFGCEVLSARNPIIYEFACVDNIDIKVTLYDTDYLNVVASPGADGKVRIDISEVIRSYIDKNINIDHFTATTLEDTFTSGYATLSYKYQDETSYATETVFYCYAQNSILDKYVSSVNNLKEGWNDREDINLSKETWTDDVSKISGFETFNVSTNNFILADFSSAGLAYSAPFVLSGAPSRFKINMTEFLAFDGYAISIEIHYNNALWVGSGIIDANAYTEAGGIWDIDMGAAVAGNYSLYVFASGASGYLTSCKFSWLVEEEISVTDPNITNYNGIDVELCNKYDFIYAGSASIYYKIPSTLTLANYTGNPLTPNLFSIIFQQLDENGIITNSIKWWGVDIIGNKEGRITFTKTVNRWFRAVAVYNGNVCDIAFSNVNPFMTGFNKINFYKDLPMHLSIMSFINRINTVHPVALSTTNGDIPLYDTVSMINFNTLVLSDSVFKLKSYGDYIVSKELDINYIDCIPSNPIYIAWINDKGGFDFYLFKFNYESNFESDDTVDVDFENEWGLNTQLNERVYEKRKKTITVGADLLSADDVVALRSIQWSPSVWMLTNPESWKWDGEQWVNVMVEKKSFTENARNEGAQIEFDIIVNRYNF